ncbi:hypothetical protein JKJ11_13205 [Vibrio sp. SCSIO 43133]|uniref:hypothetical protein n=1 Tax=Vibrio sp. SCSIO 43133 TaxID=2802577 RepID=UPI0020759A0E|nr:hypothetical protein [Vibrio sp. SCSIO 43133]USD99910.1 hypothetical protein JKJ11_13205 [Vibrio sp. SCSIO 43133]
MALEEVNTKLAQVALDNCEGFPFEQFANELIGAIDGPGFVPVGGTSDGGADGARVEGLYTKDRPNVFYQMSVTANHRPKIKQTLDRLEEFGRTVKTIIYVTSQTIGRFDKEEEDLTDKHDVFVRIRDAKWLLSKINYNEATKKAYYTHLHRFTDFLKDLSKSSQLKTSENITHPSVYVFLQQQVENREKDKHLVKTVADSLILWSLNDTDPDQDKFMTRLEINQKIAENIPWAKNIVGGMLSDRLRELVKKNGVGGKQVNYHRKGDKYCLPYDTRKIIANEKAIDESVKIDVITEISSQDELSKLPIEERKIIANIAIRTSQLFFEKEGLKCSSYLNGSDGIESNFIENTVFDRVSDALDEYEAQGMNFHAQRDMVVNIVRSMFYQSTENQRALLNKFSRTYVLLFTLQAEPRVVEYFQKATANFRLVVGTDMIVRALTERFLSKENQMTRNLFKMSNEAGIDLMLTEPALDGVIKHLIVTDNEYKNHISKRESHLTEDLIRESEQILIRTYYHAIREGYSHSWQSFMSGFLTYNELHTSLGKEELKAYIIHQFGMNFYSNDDLRSVTDDGEVNELAEEILPIKRNNQLAEGVALIIKAVYGYRNKGKEISTYPEYGYQTWWLTQESRVQRYTADLVKKNAAKYIMRPEFLLNFFSLAPSVRDIRESYKSIFPSVMGIQMGNRLPDKLFHKVLEQVDIWKEQEDGRVAAKTRMLCDKLKAEHFDEDVNEASIDKFIREVESS